MLATAPAGEEQPSAVDSSRRLLGSSPLDIGDREPVAPALEHEPKPRPKSAGGRKNVPAPLVESADAAELTCQQECIICMDQPKSVFLAPCGHMVACLRCAEEQYGVDGCLAMDRNLHCPLCRRLIRATVKAIYS